MCSFEGIIHAIHARVGPPRWYAAHSNTNGTGGNWLPAPFLLPVQGLQNNRFSKLGRVLITAATSTRNVNFCAFNITALPTEASTPHAEDLNQTLVHVECLRKVEARIDGSQNCFLEESPTLFIRRNTARLKRLSTDALHTQWQTKQGGRMLKQYTWFYELLISLFPHTYVKTCSSVVATRQCWTKMQFTGDRDSTPSLTAP